MGKSRKRTPPKRKRTKRQVPTVEDYVRKLPKERLAEIILSQVHESDSLQREQVRHGSAKCHLGPEVDGAAGLQQHPGVFLQRARAGGDSPGRSYR